MDALREHRPAKLNQTARVFDRIPRIKTFPSDCERARSMWIDSVMNNPEELRQRQRNSFLARFDDEGRQLDLHGLRTTLGTMLARSGATPQVAKMVMRHSDVRITMKHYTDLRLHDAAGAVANLPRLTSTPEPETTAARATGTDGDCSACDSAHVAETRKNEQFDAPELKLTEPLGASGESGYTSHPQRLTHDIAQQCADERKLLYLGAVGAVG